MIFYFFFRMLKSICRFASRKFHLPDKRVIYVEFGGNQEAEKTLIFLPGAIGCLETDFKPQFSTESPLAEKYRLICFEPAGYGRSRPPCRTWPKKWVKMKSKTKMKCLGHFFDGQIILERLLFYNVMLLI